MSRTMTHEEWNAEGLKLFGEDHMKWRFVCPVCAHVQSVQDYKEAGAPQSAVAFSCVGRWRGAEGYQKGKANDLGCNYAGGGLFQLNPVTITGRADDKDDKTSSTFFDFARESVDAPTFPLPQPEGES